MALENKEFQELLVKLSPTILGIKPAELLNVKMGKNFDKCCSCLGDCKDFRFIVIRDFTNLYRRQIFFYHQGCLSEILKQKANQKFLKKIGYPLTFEINRYLEILIKKLQSNIFPHEIGIFLGYPLKDVLGYMGLSPLKVVKVKGWKYYGSETLSAVQYKRFVKAREVFSFFLDNF